ncbi:hypothetical protein [Streptomyces sp. NPDC048438]|uniref:hypothetical protein n=1 Tax=Streptomyces sp. NPDC048438 TaxID=3365551 RepID=UPI00371CFDD8
MHDVGAESPLPGGSINHVVRVGATVRRPASARRGFVSDLLKLFEAHTWPGAPRFRGIDEQGREVLTYIEGHVARESRQPPTAAAPPRSPRTVVDKPERCSIF